MFLVIFHIAIFSVLVYRYKLSIEALPLKKFFLWALRYKILAGVALGMLYKIYYNEGGDTYVFFNDASQLADLAFIDFNYFLRVIFLNDFTYIPPQTLELLHQPRAFFMVKLLTFVNILTGNNYWLSGFYLSTFSFLGLWLLANTLSKYYQVNTWASAVALLFFPSFTFWSAGISKESILLGCMGFTLHYFLLYWHHQRIKLFYGIVWLLSFGIIWQLKYYYAAGLFPCLLALGATHFFIQKGYLQKRWTQLLSFILLWVVTLLLASWLHPNLHLQDVLNALYQNHTSMVQASNPQSLIHYSFEPTWQSFFPNLPKAFIAGLYRPFIGETHHIFYHLLSVENVCLAFLLIGAIYRWQQANFKTNYSLLLWACVAYIILMATLLAISSPNFGSLSRYKVGYGVFYALLCLQGILPQRQ